jgi:hypothetical protein
LDPFIPPTKVLVETSRPTRREKPDFVAILREEPLLRFGHERTAQAFAFVSGLDKHREDRRLACISHGEGHDPPLLLGHPRPTIATEHCSDGVWSNANAGQRLDGHVVLRNARANVKHARHVGRNCDPNLHAQ